MKKFVYIFCIAILGAACSKEDVNKTEIVKTIDIPENMVKLSITVPREPETRATMVSRQLSFAADDKIAVIGTLNAETSVVTLDVESISPLSITFSAAIDENMEIGDYAYFPASIVNKDNPTQINWPSSFDGTKVQMPMMAKIDVSKNEAKFHYLGAMLKVNLASAPAGVNTLEFKTTDNFVGSYNVTFDGDNNISNVVASSVSGNTETLSVNSTGTYYVPIPAGTYSEFQLAMKQGSYYHKQRTSDLDAAINPVRGNIVNLGNFAYDVDEIEEWYVLCQTNSWNTNSTAIRMFKVGGNYIGGTYNGRWVSDSDDTRGCKIISGSDLNDTNTWTNVYGVSTKYQTSGTLSKGGNNNVLWTDAYALYLTSFNPLNNAFSVIRDSDKNTFEYSAITLCYDGNDYAMTTASQNCHNWKTSEPLSVSDNTTHTFYIKSNDNNGDAQWPRTDNTVNITDNAPAGSISSSGFIATSPTESQSCKAQLTPGKYDVYYYDASAGYIMFVKRPYGAD